jgi:hypothetical protein
MGPASAVHIHSVFKDEHPRPCGYRPESQWVHPFYGGRPAEADWTLRDAGILLRTSSCSSHAPDVPSPPLRPAPEGTFQPVWPRLALPRSTAWTEASPTRNAFHSQEPRRASPACDLTVRYRVRRDSPRVFLLYPGLGGLPPGAHEWTARNTSTKRRLRASAARHDPRTPPRFQSPQCPSGIGRHSSEELHRSAIDRLGSATHA